jgi:hypothetical protein
MNARRYFPPNLRATGCPSTPRSNKRRSHVYYCVVNGHMEVGSNSKDSREPRSCREQRSGGIGDRACCVCSDWVACENDRSPALDDKPAGTRGTTGKTVCFQQRVSAVSLDGASLSGSPGRIGLKRGRSGRRRIERRGLVGNRRTARSCRSDSAARRAPPSPMITN